MRAIPLLRLVMTVALANPIGASAAQDLRIYGPGGPEPAIREAARQFGAAHGIDIAVTAGPTGRWIDAAKADADLIYSGSETMMTDFLNAMGGELVAYSDPTIPASVRHPGPTGQPKTNFCSCPA